MAPNQIKKKFLVGPETWLSSKNTHLTCMSLWMNFQFRKQKDKKFFGCSAIAKKAGLITSHPGAIQKNLPQFLLLPHLIKPPWPNPERQIHEPTGVIETYDLLSFLSGGPGDSLG